MAKLQVIGDIVIEVQYALYLVNQKTKTLIGLFNTYEGAVQFAERKGYDVHFGNAEIGEHTAKVA